MLELLPQTSTPIERILCLGAHCDDIEIGCGGSLLKLLEDLPEIGVDWVVLTSDAQREAEARVGAETFLASAGEANIIVTSFRQRFFPYIGAELKEFFDELGTSTEPDLIFTHFGDDRHQDHRLLSQLTYETFRDHLVLEYEIPKWDGDVGRPNVYIPLDASHAERKVDAIWRVFESQRDKHWFSKETLLAMMRLRGIECKARSGYAEAFHCRKLVLG
jgi:LmbE family N-acetylglucosaminyl deacetylase